MPCTVCGATAALCRASRSCWSARIRRARSMSATSRRRWPKPACTPSTSKLPESVSEAELLDLIARAQRRSGGQRHPGAIAAAEADRFAQDHRGHRSGQGRRRLSSAQCRPARQRPGRAGAVHAARLRAAGQDRACLARRPRGGGDRPLQHRRQAGGAIAAGRERDGDDRPFQDARSAGGVPARRFA